MKKYLDCLAANIQVGYTTALEHFVGYVRARHAEPCNRGALKNAHLLENSAGVLKVGRYTSSMLYNVIKRELLSSDLPGGPWNKRHACSW